MPMASRTVAERRFHPAKRPRIASTRGMYYWFLVRPWLGAVIGTVAYWGLIGKVFGDKGDLDADLPRLAFYSFVAGFLAKSLLEIFSGLLKNIFKK
jgi:hypothetical protein